MTIDKKAIIEHKTTSLSPDEYLYNLQWNEQIILYFLASGCKKAYYTICRKPTIRQKQNETDKEFAERCFAWYDEDTDDKIRLAQIECAEDEVEEYRRNLIMMFKEISGCIRSGNFYKNPSNCTMYGRRCEYSQICHNYNPEENYIGFGRRAQ